MSLFLQSKVQPASEIYRSMKSSQNLFLIIALVLVSVQMVDGCDDPKPKQVKLSHTDVFKLVPKLQTPSQNAANFGREYSLFTTLKLKTPSRRPQSSQMGKPVKAEVAKRC